MHRTWGIQYVHCVMHKCIMVKVGETKNTKTMQKHVNLPKIAGKSLKVGGKNNFVEIGGKCIEVVKIGGNLWWMTKKRSSEILADENRKNFREKVTFGKFSMESENFSEMGRKSETGGENALRGMDAPAQDQDPHLNFSRSLPQIVSPFALCR